MADSPGDGSQQGHAAGAYADPGSAQAAVSRSRFLTGATIGIGGIIGAAVAVPVVAVAVGPAFAAEDWYWTNLGEIDLYTAKPGTYVPVVFHRKPGEDPLDRRVVFVRYNGDSPPPGDDEWTLVSNTCMHLGCPVVGTALGFACPCHGGQYDTEGRVTAGPPARPLNRFEYKVENNVLYVGRVFAQKLNARDEVVSTGTWKAPGQPTNGILSYLYPSAN